MYYRPITYKTKLEVNKTTEGETIENKVIRLVQNKEPIKDGAPIIFTDRKDGVNPAYNIRTDRWEIAVDAMEKVMKSKTAQRDEIIKPIEAEAKIVDIKDTKGKPVQGEAS